MSNTIAHLAVANRILKECPTLVLDVEAFYLGCVAPDTIGSKDGYVREDKRFVHLLTDEWNHRTIRQTMLKIANARNVLESDKEFFYMMMNDLEALDNYLLDTNEEVLAIFSRLLNQEVRYALSGFIEKEYIEDSIRWWKNSYLANIKQRQLKYISEEDIEVFVDVATKEIISELENVMKR